MNQVQLEQVLDELHQTLAGSPEIEESTAQKLRTLMADIQIALENSSLRNGAPPSQESFTERMQSLISDFEVQHPKLTSNLSYIAERLADMGI